MWSLPGCSIFLHNLPGTLPFQPTPPQHLRSLGSINNLGGVRPQAKCCTPLIHRPYTQGQNTVIMLSMTIIISNSTT